jgi:hypothetical protein
MAVLSAKGHAREALWLADMAETVTRHEPSPRLHTLIALRQASAYAALGDTSAFRAAIGRARRELDRGAHPRDAPWTAFVTPAANGHPLPDPAEHHGVEPSPPTGTGCSPGGTRSRLDHAIPIPSGLTTGNTTPAMPRADTRTNVDATSTGKPRSVRP